MFSALFAGVIERHSLKLWLQSKIEQHTDLNLSRSKIIEKLSFVCSIKRSSGLKL